MKKKITTAMLIAAMSMSIMACGGDKTPETQVPTTEAPGGELKQSQQLKLLSLLKQRQKQRQLFLIIH